MFIGRDLSVIRIIDDSMIVVKQDGIAEYDSADRIFHHPRDDYTKRLVNATFDL